MKGSKKSCLEVARLTKNDLHEELRAALEKELAHYPIISAQDRANILELKSVMRNRMRRAIRGLICLRGLHLIHSDWHNALATLLDSNLIPISVSKTKLEAISEFDRRSQKAGTVEKTKADCHVAGRAAAGVPNLPAT
ncbi:MAG: hypothetical protein ACKO7W_11560 [Elainella sp.]